jgi:glycosyltransferase involved in cell wall biosynthesis
VDIGVLITFYEGISNSIIEYMAMGIPVIATDGGGTVELVKDEINGYLVEQRNEAQITKKIESLLKDKQLREEMGRSGYSWVRQKFDIAEKTNEYIELYRRVIKT